jgi:hypothetical protein
MSSVAYSCTYEYLRVSAVTYSCIYVRVFESERDIRSVYEDEHRYLFVHLRVFEGERGFLFVHI